MGPRRPTTDDMAHMSDALGVVMSYEMGTQDRDFTEFAKMTKERRKDLESVRSLAQFAWLLASNLAHATGGETSDVLQAFGIKFAQRQEMR